MKRKLLTLITIAALSASLIIGCGSNTETTSTTSAPAVTETTTVASTAETTEVTETKR